VLSNKILNFISLCNCRLTRIPWCTPDNLVVMSCRVFYITLLKLQKIWSLTVLILELHILGTFGTFSIIKLAHGSRINPVTES
jgi:hypothetical protein